MAAASIPNLNTLRASRGRGRGRGASGFMGESAESEKARRDKIVQQTDQDASVSRMSAVEVGYLNDPFAELFLTSTYVRTMAIDRLVDSFLESNPSQKKQIISLGAGTDTRYFRTFSRFDALEKRNWVYHEIDFPENNTRKLKSIARSSKLAGCIECPVRYFNLSDKSLVGAPSMVESINYHIHSVDLRTLDPLTARPSTFDSIDPSLPTLILSECCLCYLTPAAADTVALYFTKHFFPSSTPLGLVLYEPIRPDDAFGKTMVSNLATRGIVLQTLKKYGSLDSESARLKVYGFGESRGADINELWKKGVDEVEKELVARLEMVDEVEEWELLAAHYCVAWGWRYGEQESTFGLWDRWTDIFK